MIQLLKQKTPWLFNEAIRPYVFVRKENQIANPGSRHHLNWFSQAPIYKNPLALDELDFAEQIYFLENSAFGPTNLAIPRWVFYDCAVVPGFVAGYACLRNALPDSMKAVIGHIGKSEWVPLSLFIIIPTMHRGEWVAHNLCSINSLLGKQDQLFGLGFLSKAFGLWYANVELCTGMTQWGSPAIKLHSNYGHMEMIGAYAPVHTHAQTLTYRVQVQTSCWEKFFTKSEDLSFLENYCPSSYEIDPRQESSMIAIQRRIERGEGPFFLYAQEISEKKLSEPLRIYQPK